MTHEHAQPERHVPEDQIAFEMQMRDAYTEQFPENAAVFDEALDDVKRFAGYNIPKFKIVSDAETDDDSLFADNETRARADGMVDDLGYLQTGDEPPIYSFITLELPTNYTDEQMAHMSDEEKAKAEYNSSKGGTYISGELSDASTKLIDNLFDLTGAVVVEVDGRETLLKGEYHGTPIYFEQSTVKYGNIPTITSLRLLSPRVAEAQLKAPTQQQKQAFSEQTGLTKIQAQAMINKGELTRENIGDIAGLFSQTAEISNEAIEKMVDEVVEKSEAAPVASTPDTQPAIRNKGPRYESPKPTRSQRLAMKAAGVLLRRKSPDATLKRLAEEVGGYKASEKDSDSYVHDGVKRVITMSKWDETAPSRPMQKYRSGADFTDAQGAELSWAVDRTVSNERQTGKLAGTTRGRAAKALVKHATKRVGTRAHLN